MYININKTIFMKILLPLVKISEILEGRFFINMKCIIFLNLQCNKEKLLHISRPTFHINGKEIREMWSWMNALIAI